jgi:Alpha/beta hydrolase domain
LTGWNLRATERGAPGEIAEFYGSTFPLPKTKEARAAAHDPRLSIAERYASREEYMARVNAAADELIRRRFVMRQDRDFVIEKAAQLWDALAK